MKIDQKADSRELPLSSGADSGSLNPTYPTITIAPTREKIGLHRNGTDQ